MDNKGIEIIKDLLAELVINIEELGPCEHSVNVCVCGWVNLRERTEDYLSSLDKQKITTVEAWDKIIGNEHVKRAMEVSLAGQHPITIIGDPDNGGKYLEIILGNLLTFLPPCPCGNFMNPQKACVCSSSQIRKFKNSVKYRKALQNPIIVQLQTPTSRDYQVKSKGESFIDILNRISLINLNKRLEMEATDLLNIAIQRMNFTLKQVENINFVSKTIALLDNSDIIKAQHISEAVQAVLL